jgi:bifunctional non-homologous end joining protein LigD
VLLPHLKNRPITLKRYPEGVDGFFFYEKQCPSHRPEWMSTTKVPSQREAGHIDYCVMNDLPALVWAANLADLELHTFLHRAPAITRPTMIAFDLDPGPPADIVLCCQVGFWLKEIFDDLGLQTFPKTSGSKGLQIYVPLNTATDYDKTKAFAHALAERLEREHPEAVVSQMKKSLRNNKVLVDWSQNDEHKTTVNVYSLRAKAQPTVSTPVTWDEVAACLKAKDPSQLVFDTAAVVERVEKLGDLFEPVLKLKQKLPALKAIAA